MAGKCEWHCPFAAITWIFNNQDKSFLEPTQTVELLGFVIDFVAMEVRLNLEKVSAIVDKINYFLENPRSKISELAKFSILELNWWKNIIPKAYRYIH